MNEIEKIVRMMRDERGRLPHELRVGAAAMDALRRRLARESNAVARTAAVRTLFGMEIAVDPDLQTDRVRMVMRNGDIKEFTIQSDD